MLQSIGENITNLPFGNLSLVNELIIFDGIPMLSHYTNERGDDILSYWVDFDKDSIRWLYVKVTKDELYGYLKGLNTLKSLLNKVTSEFVFFVDTFSDNKIKEIRMISSYLIPEDYLAGEMSYYPDGLSEYYLNYLQELEFKFLLKDRAYIIKAEPSATAKTHGNFVSAKEGAFILENFCTSIENYVDVTAVMKYEKKFTSQSRINKEAKYLKNRMSPVVTGAYINSFEIWLAIDTLTLNIVDGIGEEIKSEIIEGYKRDVLDIDFTSEEDAKIICEKFNPVQRKKIYQPIVDVISNKSLDVTISDKHKTIRNYNTPIKSHNRFINLVLPPPTEEELRAEHEKRNRIYHLFLNLEEGTDIAKLTKKQIRESILTLFTDDKTDYPINFTIKLENGSEIPLKKPIPGILTIKENNDLELASEIFNISVIEKGIKQAIIIFKNEFMKMLVKVHSNIDNENTDTINLVNEYFNLDLL